MKLSTAILALAASSVAAHRIGGSPPAADIDAASGDTDATAAPIMVERTMQIEFDGGFKGLCNPDVMAKINAVALNTVNDILREGQDEAFQFDTVAVESQSLAAVAPHHGADDDERKLRTNWDWLLSWAGNWGAFFQQLKFRGRCVVSIGNYCDGDGHREEPGIGRRHLNEDAAIEQIEAAIADILPDFECMAGATDVYVTFVA